MVEILLMGILSTCTERKIKLLLALNEGEQNSL